MALRIPGEYVDRHTKGLWLPGAALSADEFAAARHDIFTGPFSWPLLVLRQDAVAHNVATLAAYVDRHGLLFAPHGKTSMAPKLFAAQLAAGAWAITVATASQALTAREFGVPRILLANELLDPLALRWALTELARDRDFEFLCYVDSVAGVDALRAAITDVPGDRELTVLVELGYPGGRTGVRTVPAAVAVARAAQSVPRLSVAGVAGYEGGLPTVDAAADYLGTLRDGALALVEAGAVRSTGPVLLSAGGSAYFDAVTAVLGGARLPGRESAVVLRSGAYITHDHGSYAGRTPFGRLTGEGGLRAAFELWARVTSTPEPGLALVGLGKRDAPFDEGFPIPQRLRRPTGEVVDATAVRVTNLNDQHAYLDVSHGPDVAVGDLVCFGISHPCTAFDKWRVVPMVDADHRVVDLIHTYF